VPKIRVVLFPTRAAAALLAALTAAGVLLAGGALPAGADATSTTTSSVPPGSTTTGAPTTTSTTSTTQAPSTGSTTSTSSTVPPTALPTTSTTVAGGVPDAGSLGLEVPTDEATLLALVDEVHSRLLDLQSQLANLDGELAQNAIALQGATTTLSSRQDDVYQAERRVDSLEVDAAAARMNMRDRAVAAYMHQPTADLANMLLHLEDPSTLVDARSFYRSMVDAQASAIETYDRLTKEAKSAVKVAASVRDAALHQEQQVASQRGQLSTVRVTLQKVQAASQVQATEQAKLLLQAGQSAGKFAAELAQQVAESANIEQLLASTGTPGVTPATPTGGGFFGVPVPGAPVTQLFGPSHDPFTGAAGFHPGIDFGAPTGTPIHAAGDGIVVYAGVESGYGNYTCINHGNGIATCYGHQSVLMVKVGDQVKRGQVIGLVGSTGYSTGPHLHFEVRINGQVTDPLPWLIGSSHP
jgi:murein DD-endopeptidase MepM/ murein hydrolase activator NlpD